MRPVRTSSSAPASPASSRCAPDEDGARRVRNLHRGCLLEGRVLAENRLLELPQLPTGLDPELLDQRATGRLIGVEGLRLPAAAIQREQQLAAEPLAHGVLGDHRLELSDEVGMTAQLEVRLDPRLERGQPELLQPCGLALRERLVQ